MEAEKRFEKVLFFLILMCGLTLGKKALVGAGAVVTKNVPDFAAVAGNPAKQINDFTNFKEEPE